MEDILQRNPDVDADFAANDPLGALEVLKSRGKTGDVLLVGYDGTEEATMASIEDEGKDATVAQNPYKLGLVGVKEAANAATTSRYRRPSTPG